ncbi:class I SAM-dependent methyltransferase [Burkholderia gladioli]|uniref:class I SAM-dependent methyltransferase n=1 Tax=Burkholderia gladioli TaxID=28095 RepID=UPI001C5D69C7|nr:class I SAM-dependent methyltransferase [Burkholderia gladioli]MBW5285882.1 class I SAM-dependent methyltransferase [Burkholderia gladioli]
MPTQLTFDVKNDDFIVWQGQIVMSRSEEPYFEKLFVRVSKELRPARVLEVGFGLGISADLIQRYLQPAEHHIVEIDATIYADLKQFSHQHGSVTAIEADWKHAQLNGPYDFVFYDPFDYFEEPGEKAHEEAQLLRKLVGVSGALCHPHFGDGEPRKIPGFRNVVLERFEVSSIAMADGTTCNQGAAVLCYPSD